MARYRHFKNYGEPGATVFLTTTVHDFVPVFRVPELAVRMQELLLDSCAHYGATLDAFVIMPEHIHFICRLSEKTSVDLFMRKLKAYTAKQMLRGIPATLARLFSQQRGLNQRSFWQRSYRSYPIETEGVFRQKLRYLHENPVRRGLCVRPEDYPWSSAALFVKGSWDEENGLQVAVSHPSGIVGPARKPQQHGS